VTLLGGVCLPAMRQIDAAAGSHVIRAPVQIIEFLFAHNVRHQQEH